MELENLTQKQKIILAIGAGLLLLGAVFVPRIIRNDEVTDQFSDFSESTTENSENTDKTYIEITGQVESPGVYVIREKILVIEAIELAGGLTEFADLQTIHKDISLSSYVDAGQKVYIPGTFEKISSKSESGVISTGRISINNASSEELEKLTGVGPSTAGKIIASRPYSAIEDLKNVEGIGEKTYNNLVSEITL